MKFSVCWIQDFLKGENPLKDSQHLSEVLTASGLEVESVQDFSQMFKNIIVAQIQSVKKHPNADRLTLCQVSTGQKTYSIVCGAKNHKAGDKVALALEGAQLPGGLTIKKSRIRGEESEGMLASAEELGLDKQEDGILILPPKTSLGMDFATYYGQDITLDVNVMPNRSDCLSHLGLAREVSALLGLSFVKKKKSLVSDNKIKTKEKIKVEVQDKESCPRYTGRFIEGVKVEESPAWLKERLKSIGLKSINNVVDVTNYVLWDRGQPLHAFDADKVNSIFVQKSVQGEKFVALDESTLTLTGQELTIRDQKRVLALAGVIGGKDSGISFETKNIFLESAYFRPEDVRRTSRRFGLQTDSSYRFSRGIDMETVKESLDFACALIQEVAGGKVSGDCYDFYSKPKKLKPISISLADLNDRLGYLVKEKTFLKWMKRLQCEVKKKGKKFEVLSPSFRKDLTIKEDLIEEFARLEGFDKVPETLPPQPYSYHIKRFEFFYWQKLQNLIRDQGWNQVINYSFSSPDLYQEFLKDKKDLETLGLKGETYFEVTNPISQNLSIMKNFLTPDIFKNMDYNFRHGNKWGQIFEISPCFYKDKDGYGQNYHLALGRWGFPSNPLEGKKISNVFYVKSLVEVALKRLGCQNFKWKQVKTNLPFLHPQQTLILEAQKRPVGYIGTIHPSFQLKYKMPLDISLGELNLEFLFALARKSLKFKPFSSFLTVEKDLSFVIPLSVPVGDVQKEIQKILGSNLCEQVEVFDIYEKNQERSVSFRMYLVPQKEAFTDKELQNFQNQVIEGVNKKFSISLK